MQLLSPGVLFGDFSGTLKSLKGELDGEGGT
jgi:hypothetical protein